MLFKEDSVPLAIIDEFTFHQTCVCVCGSGHIENVAVDGGLAIG